MVTTPYTLPGDGAPVFAHNGGEPIRGYTLVNNTDQSAQIKDSLGQVIDTIPPSTKGVNRGNWQALTAYLLGLTTSGLATLMLSDVPPDDVGHTTAIQSQVTAVTGLVIASAFGGFPGALAAQFNIDSGESLTPGALYALAYLSLFVVAQSSSTLATIGAYFVLGVAVGTGNPSSVLARGGITIGATAPPLPPLIPAQDARPQLVAPTTGTVQCQVVRRDPTGWAVNALVAGFDAILVQMPS